MTESEALRLVAMLTAYFRQELSEHTAALWSREIQQYAVADGMEAAQLIGTSEKFMPALSEFVAMIEDCAAIRAKAEHQPVLPEGGNLIPPFSYPFMSFEEFLRTRPDYRRRAEKLGSAWRDMVERAEA